MITVSQTDGISAGQKGWWYWSCSECNQNVPFRRRRDAQYGANLHEVFAHWPLRTWMPSAGTRNWYTICKEMVP